MQVTKTGVHYLENLAGDVLDLIARRMIGGAEIRADVVQTMTAPARAEADKIIRIYKRALITRAEAARAMLELPERFTGPNV